MISSYDMYWFFAAFVTGTYIVVPVVIIGWLCATKGPKATAAGFVGALALEVFAFSAELTPLPLLFAVMATVVHFTTGYITGRLMRTAAPPLSLRERIARRNKFEHSKSDLR